MYKNTNCVIHTNASRPHTNKDCTVQSKIPCSMPNHSRHMAADCRRTFNLMATPLTATQRGNQTGPQFHRAPNYQMGTPPMQLSSPPPIHLSANHVQPTQGYSYQGPPMTWHTQPQWPPMAPSAPAMSTAPSVQDQMRGLKIQMDNIATAMGCLTKKE